MKRHVILNFILLLALFAVFVFSLNFVQKKMNGLKTEYRLTDTDPIENAPPEIAFTTIALGSFRGLVADILWLRAAMLQEKGQYFEMAQLASWITRLQPRFTGAIAYLAWNMAYNISVTCSSYEDRWKWVSKGIELIRDEAIAYNPADPILYKELGWIYQHKIGDVLDDANVYYKTQMATMYMKVFGGTEPDWKALMAAPEDDVGFMSIFPKTDFLWKALSESGYESLDKLESDFRNTGSMPAKFAEKLNDSKKQKDLDAYFRKKWLKEVYKLDPAKMFELNNRYGKFDWRLPDAHAIYWATLGLERSKFTEREISNDRIITQSLKNAFMGGRLLMVDKFFMTVPNLNMADSVIKTFRQAFETHKTETFHNAAMKNFMIDLIVIMYNYGAYSKADKYFRELRKEFPEDASLRTDLEHYVIKQWEEDVKAGSPKQAMDIVGGLIFETCNFLAYGEIDAAILREKLARNVYLIYKKDHTTDWSRVGLPPYPLIKDRITKSCLENFPPPLSESLRNQLKNLRMQNNESEGNQREEIDNSGKDAKI